MCLTERRENWMTEQELLNDDGEHLAVEGLKKVFGKKTAVAGITLSMRKGEIVGFLGPNGAGKTTAFYMIAGFIKPTEGKILLGTQDISNLPMYKRAQMGISYLPQEASIFRKLTVEENIYSILETRSDLTKQQKKDNLEQLIEEFSIGHIRKQKAFTLSGGERRRTEIARALSMQPKYLLLDEPFSGIDPIAVAEIKSIIRRFAEKNIGVLITDHNVRDTLEITDRAYIINQGQILVSGNKDDILANEQAKQIYLGEKFSM